MQRPRHHRQRIAAISALLLATASGPSQATDEEAYNPSPLQQRVDRSFSSILIETPLKSIRGRLVQQRVNNCQDMGECDWLDRDKIRHYFWGDGPDALYLVVKSIRATDFIGRSIPALGIGKARKQAAVMTAARKFAPTAEFQCDRLKSCSATLDPGWITITFGPTGELLEIRLDGYHFT